MAKQSNCVVLGKKIMGKRDFHMQAETKPEATKRH